MTTFLYTYMLDFGLLYVYDYKYENIIQFLCGEGE